MTADAANVSVKTLLVYFRWALFEDRITEQLARQQGRAPTAATRLRAIQIVGLVRSIGD